MGRTVERREFCVRPDRCALEFTCGERNPRGVYAHRAEVERSARVCQPSMQIDLKVWLEHFEYHATRRTTLPAFAPEDLTDTERRLIAESLPTFQPRARSARRSLLRSARRHELADSVAPLSGIMALLVSEAEHHITLLDRFLEQHGISRKRRSAIDHLVSCAPLFGGLQGHVGVLVAAELIGKVYRQAARLPAAVHAIAHEPRRPPRCSPRAHRPYRR